MMKPTTIEPVFVDGIPEILEPGHIYISVRFRTASHLCACGCGAKVVTPIRPPKWRFTYDGETVSLSPSVGRWQLPCKSHYWIKQNEVRWAPPLSGREIAKVLEADARDLNEYYRAPGTSPVLGNRRLWWHPVMRKLRSGRRTD